MIPVGSITPHSLTSLARPELPLNPVGFNGAGPATSGAPDGFGKMLDGLVSTVTSKQDAAQALTRKVLLGETDQLHQSVIARQEASISFALMVEVRNKLVESYQELIRMQV